MDEGVRMDEESVADADDVALADAPPVAERPGALRIAGIVAVDWIHSVVWHTRAFFSGRIPREYGRGDTSRPVVVLIPGVYETWAFLKPVADHLNAAGYRIRIARGLGYNRKPIRDTAARFARALGRLPKPNAGCVIVAHSKGGLVGKELLLTDRERLGLLGVVAICSPFSGSVLAKYVVDPSLRAFLPTDETIVALGAPHDVNADIVSIYSTFDPHVPSSSVLPGATNVLLPVPGHFVILSTKELREAVELAVDGFAERRRLRADSDGEVTR
ncbi:hypothetical protein ASF68_12240 [Plantibacter sp. Leaf314]|nr:hypothetical protein ASF68_12240 [Plantibacter sp. Leaf314]